MTNLVRSKSTGALRRSRSVRLLFSGSSLEKTQFLQSEPNLVESVFVNPYFCVHRKEEADYSEEDARFHENQYAYKVPEAEKTGCKTSCSAFAEAVLQQSPPVPPTYSLEAYDGDVAQNNTAVSVLLGEVVLHMFDAVRDQFPAGTATLLRRHLAGSRPRSPADRVAEKLGRARYRL